MTSCSADKSGAGRVRAAVVLAASALLLFSACAIDTSFEKLVVNKSYEHSIRAGNGGGQVPLPEGEWIVAGWDIYTEMQALGGVLIQSENGKIVRLLDFYVPYHTDGRKLGQRLRGDGFCGRRDILFVTEIKTPRYNSYGGDAENNCWGIDHRPMTFYGKVPRHMLALRDFVEANGLELPVTMLVVEYRRVDGGPNRFSLNYYFNPDLEGIAPPSQLDWRTSEWHRDFAFRDPQKKAYIEKLKRWGEEWAEQVDKGFRGQLNAGGA